MTTIAGAAPQRLSPPTLRAEFPRLDPTPPKTSEEIRAAFRAATRPTLTAQQALASNAALGPAYDGNPRSDNHVSKIHTEIKVNGNTIARVYNSGAIEIADEYGFLAEELDFGSDTKVGPDLAENRAARVKAALERHGVLPKEKLDTSGLLAATLAKTPILELIRATTAQTQDEWLAMKAQESPGAFMSMTA